MKFYIKSICLLLFLSNSVFGQTDFGFLEELKGKEFYVDIALFKENDKWRLESYFKIFNHKLSFIKQKDEYRASYEMHLIVFDSQNRQVTASSIEENYNVASYLETSSRSSFLINQLKIHLLSGRYKLEFTLNDLNSTQRWSKKIDLEVPELIREKITLSSVVFARSISDTLTNPKFEKNGKEVIPSVSRVFGDPDARLHIYCEIYGGQAEKEKCILEYQAQEVMSKERVLSFKDTVEVENKIHRVFKSLDIDEFPEGEFIFTLRLMNPEGEVLDIEEEKFHIRKSILSLLKTDYQKAVDQLRYIASPEEMNKLKEVKEEERLQAWISFWRSKDPTPQTVENELQEEYYRRFAYANANFGIFNREGWTTDMGRIYIIYGHPDEVERHPFERERKPYQIWYYYQKNIQIIFVDESGYGEYEIDSIYERGFKKR
jgi:GWxTD domain-containing protein